MDTKYLNKITTQWTQIEWIAEKEGPVVLAEFLIAKYFNALAVQFRIKIPGLDDFAAHDFASQVMCELIKNDYRGVKKLERERGHLRGLFYKIVERMIRRQKKQLQFTEEVHGEYSNKWLDVYLDINDAIEKMNSKRPLLYRPFVSFYLEGKKLNEIAEELSLEINAVKQRLYSARRWLAQELKEYDA